MREVFARHYVGCWDFTEAAKRTGITERNARHLASRPDVARRIHELSGRMLKEADITAKRVLLELARVGFADIRKLVDEDNRLLPLSALDDDTAAAVAAIEVESRLEPDGSEVDLATGKTVKKFTPVTTTKIKRADKVGALKVLAQHFELIGGENDGVNALASALADRLTAARRRVPMAEEIEDARIKGEHVQPRLRGERPAAAEVPQPGNGDRPDASGE